MTSLAIRAGYLPKDAYLFDETLAKDIYDHLVEVVPRLDSETQKYIQKVALNKLEYASTNTIAALFEKTPALYARILADSTNYPSSALHSALMVWQMKQGWSIDSIDDCLYAMEHPHQPVEEYRPRQLQYLEHLILLKDELPKKRGVRLLQAIIQHLESTAQFCLFSKNYKFRAHYLGLCFNAFPQRSLSRKEFYENIHGSLQTFSSERLAFAQAIATSSIALDEKHKLFGASTKDVAALPEVVALLKPTMVTDEYKRLHRLKCFEPPMEEPGEETNHAQLNRDLVGAYCPMLFPLLELSLCDEQWKDMSVVCAHAEKMRKSKPPKEYALPLEPTL